MPKLNRSFLHQTALALSTVAAFGASAPALAGSVVTVTAQTRTVNGWVWIGGCQQQTQNVSAPDQGPFDASVALDPACAMGDSTADAEQQSEILNYTLTASGSGRLYAATTQNNVIHGSARSTFDVSFVLSESREFSLHGLIAASRQSTNPGGGHFAITSALLSGPSGAVFSRQLQPTANQSLSETVDVNGMLRPGQYSLVANANTYMDQAYNNNWALGNVSFDITLRIHEPGDVNGDGAANVDDLLGVINAWGTCPQPCSSFTCPADLAPTVGDCHVNVDDLLAVINNWE